MHKSVLVWIAVLSVALAAGCSSNKARPTPGATGNRAVPADDSATAGAAGQNAANAANAAAVANGSAPGVPGPAGGSLDTKTIYFDFDSSQIKPEFAVAVTAHAKYLAANTTIRVRLEGNTDERGTREYNIGLGERRAQAVRQALMLQGVADAQITTVSYGEERPAVTGHAEAAWAKNRRVEIVYLNAPGMPAAPSTPN
jgi:peptidoglycan-associated lipoprotein